MSARARRNVNFSREWRCGNAHTMCEWLLNSGTVLSAVAKGPPKQRAGEPTGETHRMSAFGIAAIRPDPKNVTSDPLRTWCDAQDRPA